MNKNTNSRLSEAFSIDRDTSTKIALNVRPSGYGRFKHDRTFPEPDKVDTLNLYGDQDPKVGGNSYTEYGPL